MNENKANKNKKLRKNVKSNEDIWMFSNKGCKEEWDDESNDHWMVCDSCSDQFHLQCSGIDYETFDYWT